MDELGEQIEKTIEELYEIGKNITRTAEGILVLDYRGTKVICQDSCVSFISTPESIPSIENCFQEYLSLPDDSLLKKRFDTDAVRNGYEHIDEIGFKNYSRQNYRDLSFQIFGFMHKL